MSVPWFIPEFREATNLARGEPAKQGRELLAQLASGDKCCLEGLTTSEELTILYALSRWYPDEFREFCRRVLDGVSVEKLSEIQDRYALLQLQEEARMRRVMRGIQLAWSQWDQAEEGSPVVTDDQRS